MVVNEGERRLMEVDEGQWREIKVDEGKRRLCCKMRVNLLDFYGM